EHGGCGDRRGTHALHPASIKWTAFPGTVNAAWTVCRPAPRWSEDSKVLTSSSSPQSSGTGSFNEETANGESSGSLLFGLRAYRSDGLCSRRRREIGWC